MKNKINILIAILLLTAITYAGNKKTPHFVPEDSLEYELGYPSSDSTVVLTKSGSILPQSLGKYENEDQYLIRITNDYEIHLNDSLLIIEYKIKKEIIKDTLFDFKTYLDTALTLLNQIPNGRYIIEPSGSNEIVIQTKKKYVSCLNCLNNSKGKNVVKIKKIFEILNLIQEKAYKKTR